MQIPSCKSKWVCVGAVLFAPVLMCAGQASQAAPPTPPAQKQGPPVPPGTGGPGGTTQADRMQKFLAIGTPPDPAAVQRGKTLFVGTCGFCHGSSAQGGESGPNLVRSVLVLHDENGDNIGPVIHAGRPTKGMPAFPNISNAQIQDLAAFLKSRYQAAANRGAYQIQNINTGDPKAGQTYFKEKCASCHSPAGDLAGIAKKYEPDGLLNFFLFPRPHGPAETPQAKAAMTKVTVTLPSGESYSGTLDNLDDFNVALTDSSGAYHTWPLTDNDPVKVKVDDPLAGHLALLSQYSNADIHNVLAYLETLK